MSKKCGLCQGRKFLNHGSIRIDDFSFDCEPCPECHGELMEEKLVESNLFSKEAQK